MTPGVAYDPAVALANREELRSRAHDAIAAQQPLVLETGYYRLDSTGLQGGAILPHVDLGDGDLVIDGQGSAFELGPDNLEEYCCFALGRGRLLKLRNMMVLGPRVIVGGEYQTTVGVLNNVPGGSVVLENVTLARFNTSIRVDGMSLRLDRCTVGARSVGIFMADDDANLAEIQAFNCKFALDADFYVGGSGQRHNVYIQEGVSHRFEDSLFGRSHGNSLVPYSTGNAARAARFAEVTRCVFDGVTNGHGHMLTCKTQPTTVRDCDFHLRQAQDHIGLRGDLVLSGRNRFFSHGFRGRTVSDFGQNVDASVTMADAASFVEVALDAPGYVGLMRRDDPASTKTWHVRGKFGTPHPAWDDGAFAAAGGGAPLVIEDSVVNVPPDYKLKADGPLNAGSFDPTLVSFQRSFRSITGPS